MKHLILFLALAGFAVTGCAPSSKQLKEAIEKDPSIVFVAIEKDPEQFIEVVNTAARNAQMKAAQKAQEDETKKREDEFKNPYKPVIQDGRAFMGPKDAKVVIVEYSDFECPFCRRGYETIKEVFKNYPKDVKLVFKHLPLEQIHPHAMITAQYFEAIAKQAPEKAFKFHDKVFENQRRLSEGEDFLKEIAKEVGADMKKVAKDINDESVKSLIKADMEEAEKFGFTGTPGFLVNGVSVRGALPFTDFKPLIDRHLSN